MDSIALLALKQSVVRPYYISIGLLQLDGGTCMAEWMDSDIGTTANGIDLAAAVVACLVM